MQRLWLLVLFALLSTGASAEWRRLLGDGRVDAADKKRGPGMELDTVSKYGINILFGFKPEEVAMRPEAAEILRRRAGSQVDSRPSSRLRHFRVLLQRKREGPGSHRTEVGRIGALKLPATTIAAAR